MLSVIILTYNEEQNIVRCLNSIKDLSNDIIIIDSYSTDSTLKICKEYGCRIYQHPFENHAKQFNWALDNVEINNNWIIRLDCDEIIPDKLKKEIKDTLNGSPGYDAYYLNRRMYLMNKWLRHGRMYPHYITRLFRKGKARYEEKTEEHMVVNGKTGYLKNDFLEDNRINTLDYFTKKHLVLAEGEISDTSMLTINHSDMIPKLFGPKPNRTRWLKLNIYTKTPLFVRGLFYFIYRYFFCLGFLDGREGLIFHVLQGFWYRFYVDARIFENKIEWQKKEIDYSGI
jgi:glycosyltransferase involved in cell wall biosynthesis